MTNTQKLFEFMLESGLKLEMRATTRATSSLLLFKFLRKLPPEVSSICPYTAGAACLYLSGKIEEDFVRIRDVTNVCYRILHPSEPTLDVDEKFWTLRDGISKLELFLLRTLAFKVHFNHPHKYLMCYLECIRNWVGSDDWDDHVQTTACTILSDCYSRPDLISGHLLHSPQTVALAILYLAMRIYGVTIPPDDDATDRWWLTLYGDGSTGDIMGLAEDILTSLYNNKDDSARSLTS